MLKIAFPTDDGVTISRHFGQAKYYRIISVNDGEVIAEEQVEKSSHTHAAGEDHHALGHDHGAMFEPLKGCQVLIAGGMGQPAYEHANAQGLNVLLASQTEIRPALQAFLDGKLISDPRLIHQH